MAIVSTKKVNQYVGISKILTNALDAIGTSQKATGLTALTLATYSGDAIQDEFINSTLQTTETLSNCIGLSSVAINQFDASIDLSMYESNTYYQILNIPAVSTAAPYIAALDKLERTIFADNISGEDARTLAIACQVGTTVAQYWEDQKKAGASPWKNQIGALTYSSDWAAAAIKGAILISQTGGSMQAIITGAIIFSVAELTGVTK